MTLAKHTNKGHGRFNIQSPASLFRRRRGKDSATHDNDSDDSLPLTQTKRPHVKTFGSIIISSRNTIMCFSFGVLALVFTLPLLLQLKSEGKMFFSAAAGSSSGVPQYDTVIVGAGWSGISAAKELVEGGVDDILVLEAHNYIGGRSKSVNLDGSINNPSMHGNKTNIPIEMGSEWLYAKSTLSSKLSKGGYLNGIDLRKTTHFVSLVGTLFYLQTLLNKEADTPTLKTEQMEDNKAKELYDRVWKGFVNYIEEEYIKGLDEERDGSFGMAAIKYKEDKLTDDLDVQFVDMAMAASEVDMTGGRNELSILGHDIDADTIPQHYMSVPGVGYGNTARKFAVPVERKIQLQSKVTEIDYSNTKNAIITFTKDGVESKVAAKTVVVTVSLGVLKAGNIKFTPSLPDWKQEVIDGMGFGLLNKCVLQWNNPDAAVWPEREWIELITPRGENSTESGKWTTFFNPTSYKGTPILVAWAAADHARYMETQTDDDILSDVMARLKSMFPTITPPDRHIITRWGSEENVRGTYSFEVVGRDSFNEDSRVLQRTVGNVWFAGEATGRGWYGTVNGACQSGEEAAESILEVLTLAAKNPVMTMFSKLLRVF